MSESGRVTRQLAVLKRIADFFVGYQISSEGGELSDYSEAFNNGIATAASQVLDENDNHELIAALNDWGGESPWVSVEERLPEVGDRVLVWNSCAKEVEPATVITGKRFIDESGTWTDLTEGVTHWMEKPAPPTEGQ